MMKKIKWVFGICLMFISICCARITVNAKSSIEYIRSGDFSYHELKDGTISIKKYYGTDETVLVPSEIDGKKVSGLSCFEGNIKIKHVIIEEGIVNIHGSAFRYCINLETVYLPEGIEEISQYSFRDCQKLKTINIPYSAKTIDYFAFMDCKSLESIVIPNNETSVHLSAFSGCHSLTIYANSDSTLGKIAKGNGFHFICISHPQIITDEAIPPTCTQDGKTEGTHCPVCNYKVEQETIKATGHSWDEGIITLEPTLTTEGEKLFTCKTCKTIETEKIAKLPLPQTGNTIIHSDDSYKVTKSGTTDGTVQYSATKKSKTTITIPDTVTIDGITYKVTAVSKNAFKNNKKLKKVIIGKNVTKIEANAFSGCKNLKTITVKSTKLKSVGKNAFKGINAKAKIKVPVSKLKKYKKLMSKKGQKSTVKIVK